MFARRNSLYFGQSTITPFRISVEKGKLFRHKKYSTAKLTIKIKQLEVACGLYLDPLVRASNIQEKKSVNLLKSIVKHSDRDVLQSTIVPYVESLVQCAMVLVQAYVAHLKIRTNFWDKFKTRPFAKSTKYFNLLVFKLIPEMTDIVIDAIVEFLNQEKLWNVEFICCEILTSLLACGTPPTKILTKMLDYLEEELKLGKVQEARHVVRVLHKILNEQFWHEQKASDCNRLIQLFYDSVLMVDVENPYFQMRCGFGLCLVRMCEVVYNQELMIIVGTMFDMCFGRNLKPEMLADFGHALELAILYADVDSVAQAVEPRVLQYILAAITSHNLQKSRLASRLLARLFDRHRNFAEFATPRLFFPSKHYNIKISASNPEDKEFFLRHRTVIEYNLLYALRLHQTAANLETIFTILCTMVVESPCGYTACQVISILLELQDFALAINGNLSTTKTNQMHAVVISVMTLIAWLHRASSLSLYVQRILNRRADDAPHLNPPIKLAYQYAKHHILWNEPRLFFDFWEIRYGLWKRFRSNEPQLPMLSENVFLRKIKKVQLGSSSKGDRVKDEIIASNLVRKSAEINF